jgi:hypothetical protein
MQLWLTVIQAAGTAVTLAAAVTNLTTALLARRRTQGGEAHRASRHRWRAVIRRRRTGKVTSVAPSALAPVPYAARSRHGSLPCPGRTDRNDRNANRAGAPYQAEPMGSRRLKPGHPGTPAAPPE